MITIKTIPIMINFCDNNLLKLTVKYKELKIIYILAVPKNRFEFWSEITNENKMVQNLR